MGIKDWDKKKWALKQLFIAFTDGELARKIAKPSDQQKADNLVTNGLFGRWARSTPTQYRWFFESLLEQLKERHGANAELTVSKFYECPYGVFLESLPVTLRAGLEAVPIGTRSTMLPGNEAYQAIWIKTGSTIETIADGVRRGRVDQRHYYLNPESANRWMALIDSRTYPTYEECLSGLNTFLASDTWNAFLSRGQCGGVAMLGGGGAPTKDTPIIDSLLKYTTEQQPIPYALIDISFYMLEQSFHWLDRHLKVFEKRHRLDLRTLRWDFVELDGAFPLFRNHDKAVAWFLTGQTLGNINEKQFFETLKCEKGDMLIIGTEFIDDVGNADEISRIVAKFDSMQMRDFLKMPLLSISSVLDVGTKLEEALRRIKVRIVDGYAGQHSSIPASRSVEVYVRLNNKDITLVTSTRYKEEELVAYAARFGLEHVVTTRSPLNKSYRHVCFRKVA